MNSFPPVTDPTKVSDAGQHQRIPKQPSAQGVNFMAMDDPCWVDDPVMLVKPARLIEFFPVRDQSTAERFNALSRMILYIGVGVSILEKRTSGLQIATLLLGVFYLLWKTAKNRPPQETPGEVSVESFDVLPPTCTDPSPGNPFMNFVPGDPVDRGPACTGPGTEQMVTNFFEEGLYSDVTENVFMKPGNPRSFFTQPVTTLPNDRDKFADWLYRDGNLGNPDQPRKLHPPSTYDRPQRQLRPSDLNYNDEIAPYPEL